MNTTTHPSHADATRLDAVRSPRRLAATWRRFTAAWLACVFAACSLAVHARAQVDVPRADGWVTDLADVISAADETALEAELESWKRGSGHELAVLTVPSLGGRDIESYALTVARAWKLGSKEENDGALLVVARDDRKMRIEVGRGLEGSLTDLMSSRILRDVLTPAFRRGEFSSGIRQGVAAIRDVVGGDLSRLPREPSPAQNMLGPAVSHLILLVSVFLVLFVISRIARGARGGVRGGFPYIGPIGGGGFSGGSRGGGGFGGFGGGGGFSGGGSSGSW